MTTTLYPYLPSPIAQSDDDFLPSPTCFPPRICIYDYQRDTVTFCLLPRISSTMTRQPPSSLSARASSGLAEHLPHRDIAVADKPHRNTFTVHTTLLFDPHQKAWRENVSIEVDKQTGLIASVSADGEHATSVEEGDVDLRGYTVMPGFGMCC